MRAWPRRRLPIAAVLALTAGGPLQGEEVESPDAYEIVASAAVPILPEPLREFFEAHFAAFQQSATTGHASRPASPGGDAERHYILLDVAAKGANDFHEAAKRFPRDRAAAKRLFRQRGKRHGGILPWAIGDSYQALQRAFGAGDREAIVREAGVLLHLATDASWPLNTTTLGREDHPGQSRTPPGAANGDTPIGDNVRYRLDLVLRCMRERLAFEVRVWPGRYDPVMDPVEAAFDRLLDAHGTLDPLLRIDAAVMAQCSGEDSRTRVAVEAAYRAKMVDRAGQIVESQLEAAALCGANMIGGAWVRAGRPSLDGLADTEAGPTARGPRPDSSSPFVGSRNSTIVHKATCSHALRIKQENLVGFGAMAAARQAGRKPCKVCRPDAQ